MTDPKRALTLPADAVMVAVRELPPGIRERLDAQADSWIVTRRRSRLPTKVLDSEGAALLREFTKPCRLVEAVFAFSLARRLDPEQTLRAAFPLLQELVAGQLLVEAGSHEAAPVRPTLRRDTQVDGYRIEECLAALTDTEVYRARTSLGVTAALKIARPGPGSAECETIHHEAVVLRHLEGHSAPRLLTEGVHDGRRYIVTEWVEGTDVETTARQFREAGTAQGAEGTLDLCLSVLDAFAELHAHQVVHGDVQPDNVRVGPDASVTVIDFGWSSIAGRHRVRAGVTEFFEPEYAQAVLAGEPPPSATLASDQYAIAALLYRLVNGQDYLPFSLNERRALLQIRDQPPVGLASRWAVPPAVQQVLRRALAKHPESRFATIAEFREAFATAGHRRSESGSRKRSASGWLLAVTLRRLSRPRAAMDAAAQAGPVSSLYLGMAGTALGLLRIACIRENPRLLAVARRWAYAANAMAGRRRAFVNQQTGFTPELVGRVSTWHSRPGMPYLAALFSDAVGDCDHRDRAIQRWLAVTRLRTTLVELAFGQAGILLTAGFALELADESNPILRRRILGAGTRVYRRLLARLKRMGEMSASDALGNLGVAHGWAGVLYSMLRWQAVTARGDHTTLAARLDQLRRFATRGKSGARWPWFVPAANGGSTVSYMPGWCNGSAGMVSLWTLAARVTGDESYSRWAELAAEDAWATQLEVTHLCCGTAGNAYGLLNLYRFTGDRVWLDRARTLTERAAAKALQGPSPSGPEPVHSLFRGDLGVAVLIADLERPDESAIPLYEAAR